MKHRCVIIDDEPVGIEVIKNHLAKLDDFELLASFTKPLEAIQFLGENAIDLIFLDIEMPSISGFELLKSLPKPPKVILTTAHREYAPEAFDLNVLDYLLKPVSLDRLLKAINRYYQSLSKDQSAAGEEKVNNEAFIIVKADKRFHKIHFSDIVYIESMDDFIRFHIKTGKLDSYDRLVHLEEKLPSNVFWRIHRSYIVNSTFIDSFTSSSVQLSDKTLVIGKNYRELIIKKLQ